MTDALCSAVAGMHAAFETLGGHRTVVVRWIPEGAPSAQLLVVPGFGDEMSQTRRMIRLVAEALVARGVACTLFDPYGTGDSSADFAQASVERWLADYEQMLARIASGNREPVLLLGCRLGVALAAALTRRSAVPVRALIGWAPVLQGRVQLSALLRASKLSQTRNGDAAASDPRAGWTQGETSFLAGYPISPQLASSLEQLDASVSAPRVAAATLIEVRPPLSQSALAPSEGLENRARSWRAAGIDVDVLAVEGAPFWNVPDLVDLPALVQMTIGAIDRHMAGLRA